MKPLLLLVLLIPFYGWSQTVKPVESADYMALTSKDSSGQVKSTADTFNSIKLSHARVKGRYSGEPIEKISVQDNKLVLKPYQVKYLWINGTFTTRIESRRANRLPELQKTYVQGQSANGGLAWNGPESNEVFSYGPAIGSLEFDGSKYDYDVNGRLVRKGTGNGQAAKAYDNNILQKGLLLSNSLFLQTKYRRGYVDFITGTFKINKLNETTIIPNNDNDVFSASAAVDVLTKIGIISGSYFSQKSEFASNNRNGLLNRIYQNALLTPASFSNGQGYLLNAGQRRYSEFADNPDFLVNDHLNKFQQKHQTFGLGLSGKKLYYRYKLTQSYEDLNQDIVEHYRPGTAFFEGGLLTLRNKYDRNYNLRANLARDFKMFDEEVSSTASINYVGSFNKSGIDYFPRKHYSYNRNAHDVAINFKSEFRQENFEATAELENKFYASSTTLSPDFFLPNVSLSLYFRDIDQSDFSARITGQASHFNCELPLNQSFSQLSLLQYSTENAFQYVPVMEVKSFDKLEPIRRRDLSLKAELEYKYKLRLYAELFQRKTIDDVFPVLDNNTILLQNIASHTNSGFEMTLSWNNYGKKINWFTSLSLTSYRSLVTDVREGYNGLPIAGFNNVFKAIVKGQPLGVIAGKAFLRNANNQLIIGSDGFPLANPLPRQIANPHPDFVMKFWNSLSWKKLSMNVSLEWKKGGQMWNGTAGALDYYGRSKNSGELRNTTGYVFGGVTTSGQVNSTPVSFYDPSQPVTNNRWTRYGFGGVDEEYIQKADYIRINNLSFSYRIKSRKYVQSILLGAFVNNILVWTPYGGDPTQLLYDQSDSAGLDFFNLPSLKLFGFSATIQF